MSITKPPADEPDLRSAYASLTAPCDAADVTMPAIRARINQRRRNRRRRITAVACSAALAVGGGFSAAAYTAATQIPVTTSTGRSGAVPAGTAASCAFGYSPTEVRRETDWAADATISKIRRSALDRNARVTLSVTHWYRGGTASEITLRMSDPLDSQTGEDPHPTYGIGTRLLLSGTGQGTQLSAWPCGFTRYYDPTTATAWAKELN